jgi:Xaa-Pro dipeptidase
MLLNKDRAHQVMEKYGVEAIIATKPENITYLTDFWSLTHNHIKTTQNYAVLPSRKDIDPFIVTTQSDLDLAAANESCWIKDFSTFGTFFLECPADAVLNAEEKRYQRLVAASNPKEDAVTALVAHLSDIGLTQGRIAIDEMNLPLHTYRSIEKQLPQVQFTQGYEMIREIRAIKTPEELARLERSSAIIEKGIAAAMGVIREGITEIDIWQTVFKTVIAEGALPGLPALGAGHRSALSNALATDYRVRPGDLIRFDVGCIFKGYHSDTARIAVLGSANDKQRTYHEAVRIGEEEALGIVCPGVRASEIFDRAVEAVRASGIPHYQRNHVGHGIGIEVYEPPLLAPASDFILEEGMILNVETPYYELGFGGVQVEDTIVITENGYRSLTKCNRELHVI